MAHPNTGNDTPGQRSSTVRPRSRNPTTPGDLPSSLSSTSSNSGVNARDVARAVVEPMQLSSGYLDIRRLNPLLDCRTAYVDAPTCLRFTNNQTAIPIPRTDSKRTASTTMAPPRLMLSLPQLGKFFTARDATPPPCAPKKPTKTFIDSSLPSSVEDLWFGVGRRAVARIAATGYTTLG